MSRSGREPFGCHAPLPLLDSVLLHVDVPNQPPVIGKPYQRQVRARGNPTQTLVP